MDSSNMNSVFTQHTFSTHENVHNVIIPELIVGGPPVAYGGFLHRVFYYIVPSLHFNVFLNKYIIR